VCFKVVCIESRFCCCHLFINKFTRLARSILSHTHMSTHIHTPTQRKRGPPTHTHTHIVGVLLGDERWAMPSLTVHLLSPKMQTPHICLCKLSCC